MRETDVNFSDPHTFDVVTRDPHIYDNCIVTRNEDSDSVESDSIYLPLYDETDETPSTSTPQLNTPSLEQEFQITCADIESAQLTKEEMYLFMLATLDRTEKYFNNMREDLHTKWLQREIKLVRCMLTKTEGMFRPKRRRINGFISNAARNKKERNKNQNGVAENAKKTSETTNLNTQNNGDLTDQESVVGQSNGDLNNQKSVVDRIDNMRRSKRLQEFAETRELVHCDRSSYIARRLPSFDANTTLPIIDMEAKQKKKLSKPLCSENTNDKKSEPNFNRCKSLKTKSLGNPVQNKNNNNKRRVRSLGAMEQRDVKEKSEQRKTSNKRRGTSLDGQTNKKMKRNSISKISVTESNNNSANGSTSSRGKRSLYAPDRWLNSLSTMRFDDKTDC